MSLAVQTARQAIKATRSVISLDDGCPASECRFEILRSIVWGLAVPPNSVHVTRVLGSGLASWRLLAGRRNASDEILRAELREALSTLHDTGDLFESRGGYWCSATARFVQLHAGTGYLLIGGVPTALLGVKPDSIQYHGPYRHVAEVPPALARTLPLEELESWAQLPSRDLSLQDWASEALASLELRPYAPATSEAFEFYMPGSVRRGTPQFKRWSESAGGAQSKLLARRTRLYGAREFRLVETRSGRITSACDLEGFDVRRLMYALDLQAGNPVLAYSTRVGNGVEWLFKSELPRSEQRIFAALGRLTIPDDRPWVRKWTFVGNEKLPLELLRSLGVELESAVRKDRG